MKVSTSTIQSALYGLTGREVEALMLAAAGHTNAQIASKLGVRSETIKKHLDHVYATVGVGGRGRAAAHALALGLPEAVSRQPTASAET